MDQRLIKVGEYLLLVLAFLFSIIGLATREWSTTNFVDYGAFRSCSDIQCVDTDSSDQLNIDSDSVRAVQAFGVIGVLVTLAAVLICILSELKSCTSNFATLLANVHQLRMSKIFMIICIIACISLMLSWIIWLDVDSDIHDSDLGFSWAFIFLTSIFMAVLAFYPHADPTVLKGGGNSQENSGAVVPA